MFEGFFFLLLVTPVHLSIKVKMSAEKLQSWSFCLKPWIDHQNSKLINFHFSSYFKFVGHNFINIVSNSAWGFGLFGKFGILTGTCVVFPLQWYNLKNRKYHQYQLFGLSCAVMKYQGIKACKIVESKSCSWHKHPSIASLSAVQQCGSWPEQANEITSLGATWSEQKKQNIRPRGRSLFLFNTALRFWTMLHNSICMVLNIFRVSASPWKKTSYSILSHVIQGRKWSWTPWLNLRCCHLDFRQLGSVFHSFTSLTHTMRECLRYIEMLFLAFTLCFK